MIFETRAMSQQSYLRWRSQSVRSPASSPDSAADNREEYMELDTSEEHPSLTPTYHLWSRVDSKDEDYTSPLNSFQLSLADSPAVAANDSRTAIDTSNSQRFGLSVLSTSQLYTSAALQQATSNLNCSRASSRVARSHSLNHWPSFHSVTYQQSFHSQRQHSPAPSVDEYRSGSRDSWCSADAGRMTSIADREKWNSSSHGEEEAVEQTATDDVTATEANGTRTRWDCCRQLAVIVTTLIFVIFACVQLSSINHERCVGVMDVTSLHRELVEQVFGQHVATQTVVSALHGFNDDMTRPLLVMLWHGSTGVGKNYMSQIIARHLAPSAVNKLILPLHFPHGTEDEARDLHQWVVSNVSANASSCGGLQLFIVDEVDKTSSSVSDSLYATLTELSRRHDDIRDNKDRRRAVVLLLSNDGAPSINDQLLRITATGGRSRDSLVLDDLRPVVLTASWLTRMIDENIVDVVVPFLPLERRHVVQCIETELRARQISLPSRHGLIDDILSQLQFFPWDSKQFVKTGCRKISFLIDLLA